MITIADSARAVLLKTKFPTDTVGVRMGVRSSGCSGLAYVFEYCYNRTTEDYEITCNDISIFVDPKSMIHLKGTRLEYQKRGLQEGFEFVNPNVSNQCGCGESFYVS